MAPFLHQCSSSAGASVGTGTGHGGKRKKFRRSWTNHGKAGYNFSTENDIKGIVMLEIQGATDLPHLKNSMSPPSFLIVADY
jgi:phosphatidylserine decarboxylase